MDWFKSEERKDELSKLNPVSKLSETEIEEEVDEAQKERFIQLPKKYIEQVHSQIQTQLQLLKRTEIAQTIHKLDPCVWYSNGPTNQVTKR